MEKGFYAFGTMNYIRIDEPIETDLQNELINEVENLCNNLDDTFSIFKPDSEISLINKNAGIKAVKVSDETFMLLERAKFFSKKSNGAFDITISPIVKLWGFGEKEYKIPDQKTIIANKRLVNYKQLILNKNNHTVFLKRKGQSIDLGGIAKGYAVDVISNLLVTKGVTSGLLNFGGTISAIGRKTDGSLWKIGVQNPLDKRGISVGKVLLRDDILVTSGVNERFFVKNGIRYHHIINPKTCEPSQSKVLSVTAAGGCGMDLDGITTAMFVLGQVKGIKLAKKLGFEVLYLMDNGEIVATEGFANGKYKFTFK